MASDVRPPRDEDLYAFGYLAPIVLSPETLAAVLRELHQLKARPSGDEERRQAEIVLDGIDAYHGGR